MDFTQREIAETAIKIFKLLISGEEVSINKNREFYISYFDNSEVGEFLDFLTGEFDMELYNYADKLFICPEAGNAFFGYTNEDLKKKIPYVNKNRELYLCYFIIMTFITLFYKESAMDTLKDYVKFGELIEKVTKKFETLVKEEDLEKMSKEHNFNFSAIARAWRDLPDAREDRQGGKNDKVSFVKNVCNFLAEEKLVIKDEERNALYPSDRFKAIIYKYFQDTGNKDKIYELVNSLGEE